MRFSKMHGAGNDYVVVDARGVDADWAAMARAMCDRHMGVGADGLLLAAASDAADVRMRMFNPDGSEAEMCGNGIRCLARFALERGMVEKNKSPIVIETKAGVRVLEPAWRGGKVVRARVGMGKAELRPARIPVSLPGRADQGPVMDYPLTVDGVGLKLTFVSMGNPHAIAFVETPVGEFALHSIGPKVERHAMFPNRVNFSIVNVDGWGRLTARVWERGAGETLACGTGACAIAVASRLQGFTGDAVDIMLPGGTLHVAVDGGGEVWLEGPVEEVFEGEWHGGRAP